MSKQIELLRARRFLPLLLTQTTRRVQRQSVQERLCHADHLRRREPRLDPGAVAAIAGGALIAPFFLFSATAGELADRFERSRLLQILKAAELVAVLGAAAALLTGNLALSLVSAVRARDSGGVFEPGQIRAAAAASRDRRAGRRQCLDGGRHLSLDPRRHDRRRPRGRDRLGPRRLLRPAAASARVAGFAASLRVPTAPAPSPGLRVSWNLVAATAGILHQAWQRREVRLSILGASWFWLVGAVSLSQLPAFAKDDARRRTAVS